MFFRYRRVSRYTSYKFAPVAAKGRVVAGGYRSSSCPLVGIALYGGIAEIASPIVELIILALSENWDLNKYPIFAQNWACVGASCLDHLFLPIFP